MGNIFAVNRCPVVEDGYSQNRIYIQTQAIEYYRSGYQYPHTYLSDDKVISNFVKEVDFGTDNCSNPTILPRRGARRGWYRIFTCLLSQHLAALNGTGQ